MIIFPTSPAWLLAERRVESGWRKKSQECAVCAHVASVSPFSGSDFPDNSCRFLRSSPFVHEASAATRANRSLRQMLRAFRRESIRELSLSRALSFIWRDIRWFNSAYATRCILPKIKLRKMHGKISEYVISIVTEKSRSDGKMWQDKNYSINRNAIVFANSLSNKCRFSLRYDDILVIVVRCNIVFLIWYPFPVDDLTQIPQALQNCLSKNSPEWDKIDSSVILFFILFLPLSLHFSLSLSPPLELSHVLFLSILCVTFLSSPSHLLLRIYISFALFRWDSPGNLVR